MSNVDDRFGTQSVKSMVCDRVADRMSKRDRNQFEGWEVLSLFFVSLIDSHCV